MAAEHAGPIRVALVDDSVAVREMMRMTLEDEGGFTVVGEASNGLDGLELIAAEKPDAVLLDLAMPGMDGLRTIPKIREAAPEVKIVVLSLAGRSLAADALEAGADAYFGKAEPISHVVIGLQNLFAQR